MRGPLADENIMVHVGSGCGGQAYPPSQRRRARHADAEPEAFSASRVPVFGPAAGSAPGTQPQQLPGHLRLAGAFTWATRKPHLKAPWPRKSCMTQRFGTIGSWILAILKRSAEGTNLGRRFPRGSSPQSSHLRSRLGFHEIHVARKKLGSFNGRRRLFGKRENDDRS
jgi:hypothetical protein